MLKRYEKIIENYERDHRKKSKSQNTSSEKIFN